MYKLVKLVKLSLLLGCVLGVAGCANKGFFRNRDNDYQKNATSIPPVTVPSGLSSQKLENYYPVPAVHPTSRPAPTLIPPGSLLEKQAEQAQTPVRTSSSANTVKSATALPGPAASATSTVADGSKSSQYGATINAASSVAWQKAQDGTQLLVLHKGYEAAWAQMATAITSAGYQILDQDNTLGSFYILDKQDTGGKITRTTPIYRISLQAAKDSANTEIKVLNQSNQAVTADVAGKILGTLKNKLS